MAEAKPLTDEELEVWNDPAMFSVVKQFNEDDILRFLDTITADRKRFGETIDGYTKDWADQKRKFQAEIERLRGALEPFAPTFDIMENACWGIFLGGLIRRNFVDARQALDGKEVD